MFGLHLSRRAALFFGLAALAGIIAGVAAVYVSGSGNGNVAAVSPECAGAAAVAGRMAPLARGEVAAFRVNKTPDLFNDLAFKGPDGSDMTLKSFAGKVTLVNLWATWCVPCRAEMSALDRLQAATAGEGFTVAAINVDVRAGERALAFLDDIGVKNLAFYSDPSLDLFNTLKKRGLALGLPTTFLIDANGCRLGIMEGPAEWDSPDARKLLDAAVGA